ncbi:undecaprenyldiphospho-muramoylpentapeptide beta-N-acetylglucosaminyltransferase [Rothia sp. P13129]|uniref:undecaprenyldiphospho-muramoylpentapeptide beta-N-acetylglucosaminyltransferase n=1 Tax=unclassified Rothia (in: high G+C Gram-positive bacteria) TaxID=2689056 RepID=UPI003AD78F4A
MTISPSIVLAGGGTAGHINPMLAIAREVTRQSPDAKILMVGTEDGLEADIVPQAGYEIAFISRAPFPRRPNLAAVKFPVKFMQGVQKARQILMSSGADVVVGVGGYVCPPMYIAAQMLSVPVVIHEANAKPGMANVFGAKRAAFVGTAFPDTKIAQAQHVGMPMRENIESLDRESLREDARKRLGLDPSLPTLVVTGGSLGAKSLNDTVEGILSELPQWNFQILHITGRDKSIKTPDGMLFEAPRYVQREFITSMEDVYAAADLLVVRSGAATVSEVAAVGVPAVFVPLPIGNGEQEFNARSLIQSGAGVLVKDAEFTTQWFVEHIPALLADANKLRDMSEKSYAQGIRNAASTMATEVLKAVKHD